MFRTKGEARQHLKDRARFGFDYRLPEPEVNERARQSPSGRGYAAQLALTEVVTRFDREAQAVERDDRLTSKGKAERLAELARESLKRVDVLRVRLYDSIESDLAELQKQAASPTRKPGDIEQLMLEREVRDRLLQMDDARRIEVLQSAIESGDSLTVESILSAPKIVPLVPDEIAAEARQRWYARQNPELAGQLEDAVVARDVLQSNFTGIKTALEALAGVEPAGEVVGKGK